MKGLSELKRVPLALPVCRIDLQKDGCRQVNSVAGDGKWRHVLFAPPEDHGASIRPGRKLQEHRPSIRWREGDGLFDLR